MRIPIRTLPHPLRATAALGLLTAPTCTSTVDFDGVPAGEQLSGQYSVLPGVEFITVDAGCGTDRPAPERWRLPCRSLPTVIRDAAARSRPHVANVRWGSREFVYNAACGRLVRPARRLRLQVRNAAPRAHEVTLIGVDASGTEVGRSVRAVSPGTGFVAL